MASESSGKKKRTLVVIDGDALREGSRYDFSFLENQKRLEIWFFYKDKVNHSFKLRRDFSAQNVLLPRYEDDLHLYILKRVCYELGKREGRYRRAIFVGSHHPIWEGLVQFLRERGLNSTHILAEDYRESSNITSAEPHPTESTSPLPLSPAAVPTIQESFKTSPASPPAISAGNQPKKSPSKPKSPPAEEVRLSDADYARLFKRKGRVTDAHIEIYARVISALRTLPKPEVSISDFRQMLRKMNISIKNNLPGSNLNYFLSRLAEAGFITVEADKIIIHPEA